MFIGGDVKQITYGGPRVRIPHLKCEKDSWEIKLHAIRTFSIIALDFQAFTLRFNAASLTTLYSTMV